MNKKLLTLSTLCFLTMAFGYAAPNHRKSGGTPVIDAVAKHRLDSVLKYFIDANKTMGVSALIFENGKEVYYNNYGYADREANKQMARNTIVRIYSMTKPIIGVALMSLYEKGAFKLDDPLSKYAPEFANMKVFAGTDAAGNAILEPAKRPITIRDITRHTAGFAGGGHPVLSEMVKKADIFNADNTLPEMAKRLASLPLAFHPGDEWAYGPSVDVQAYLVEKLSGMPLEQYLKQTIFDPLKMTNTRYFIPEKDRKRFAAVYNRSNEGVFTRMPDEQANALNTQPRVLKMGGYGLTSTIDDYMKFAQMLVHKGQAGKANVLKPATVELMATNQLPDTITKRMWLPDRGQMGFGIDFGVRIAKPKTKEENNGVVGEFFWDGAMSTLFWVDPVNKLTAVMFTQLNPYDRVKLHNSFRDAVYGEYDPDADR